MDRLVNSKIMKDTRKFFTFHHIDGRLIETKSSSKEEAKAHIEKCLKTKLKKAA